MANFQYATDILGHRNKLKNLGNCSFQCLCLFSLQLTMNDFSVHRIIGRGGFGEVYGCRKADTGKM